MKIFLGLLLAFVTAAVQPSEISATAPTGIYSDMKYIPEAGDLLGVEIFLFRGEAGYYVLFQAAEGVPSIPVLVGAVLEKDKLTFNLPTNKTGYSGTFIGFIYHNRLEGQFSEGQLSPGGTKVFVLKKGKSYWQ